MKLEDLNIIYFLGIGGIGMSALARYFHQQGVKVSGYDRTETSLTQELEKEGIVVHYADQPELIPGNVDLVIYTPAIPSGLNEFEYVKEKGFTIRKRSEVLGMLSARMPTIAIGGTHGKSSVSAMVAHILHCCGPKCNAFIGGILKNYNSNLILSPAPEYLVVEADEFDRSFLQLFPEIAVVTSVESDHLDIYGDFDKVREAYRKFVKRAAPYGKVIVNLDYREMFSGISELEPLTFSIDRQADYQATNIMLTEERLYRFDIIHPGGICKDVQPGVPGLFNVENALAAAAVAFQTGMDDDSVRKGLSGFMGLYRRFDVQLQTPEMVYIDDYAHHPTEIESLIDSVRKMFPGKRIAGVFQPHLYTRTRDMAREFAESLENLDDIFLLDIYPARELPIEGVDAGMILEKIRSASVLWCSKETLLNTLDQKSFDVLLTMGAGDIDRMVPEIKEYLLNSKRRIQ